MVSTKELFDILLEEFGPQNWWPGDSDFEIMVGAILTQNVNWSNVEKALDNMKKADSLNLEAVCEMEDEQLEALVRPTGFYRQKAARLKRLSRVILEKGGIKYFLKEDDLRELLLDVKGIGPETADSIALYAARIPTFVVDAYTKRIVERFYGYRGNYDDIKDFFQNSLPKDVDIYNEYHALLVKLGKTYCKKTDPRCGECPISYHCSY